jgi:hypothetical protein
VEKFHNEKLHVIFTKFDLDDHTKEDEMVGHVARMGEKRNEYKMLVGKLKGKRPLGRPRHRWEDNIRMDLRK